MSHDEQAVEIPADPTIQEITAKVVFPHSFHLVARRVGWAEAGCSLLPRARCGAGGARNIMCWGGLRRMARGFKFTPEWW